MNISNQSQMQLKSCQPAEDDFQAAFSTHKVKIRNLFHGISHLYKLGIQRPLSQWLEVEDIQVFFFEHLNILH